MKIVFYTFSDFNETSKFVENRLFPFSPKTLERPFLILEILSSVLMFQK